MQTSRVLNADCRLVSQSCHTDGAAGDQMHQHGEHTDHVVDTAQEHNLHEGDPREMQTLTGDVKTSEDGFNWRKYGQKLVRGYPRSYYRCTHPNYHVRKKLERSHDDHTTEIIYKGSHDHPKPHSKWELTKPSFLYDEMSEKVEANGSLVEVGLKDIKVGSDWGAAGLETSTPVLTDSCHLLSNSKLKSRAVETPEISSTLASHAEDDEDKSGTKRRKTKKASRRARKPKVVVQLESEVHILNDGYRWRKYGQKVVRRNTNPRSYYQCTSAGCSVRKHVEKACHNKKSFIVTYEGNHNNEMLCTKNSGHSNLGGGVDGGTLFPAAGSSTGPTPTLPKNANAAESEEQVQDPAFCFERIPDLGNDFLESSLLGNFSNAMKFEPSSIYQVNFPFSQISTTYGSFLPDFTHSLPLNIPLSASNMEPVDADFNNHGKSAGSVGYFVGGQRLRENDARLVKRKQEQNDVTLYDTTLVKPKQEQSDDTLYDSRLVKHKQEQSDDTLYYTHLLLVDNTNASSSTLSSSLVYCGTKGSSPS
ncbi:WRKY transcription factor [Actinidia chinensis var. chinensis]|uniref:WRKY transcription factor n=1 Tax=Actinidia chinensis var. chinensis TaxID=1590841 RepID=A0A2R6PWB5_ACTCC|nr:WRKY transcription factor [Actinidia chinensis var. chinensis]